MIRGSLLQVTITSRAVVYELLSGHDLEIRHFDHAVVLRAGRPVKRTLERLAAQIGTPLPPAAEPSVRTASTAPPSRATMHVGAVP
jgi:hypothetical protein